MIMILIPPLKGAGAVPRAASRSPLVTASSTGPAARIRMTKTAYAPAFFV